LSAQNVEHLLRERVVFVVELALKHQCYKIKR
jgi:hypothetical protein